MKTVFPASQRKGPFPGCRQDKLHHRLMQWEACSRGKETGIFHMSVVPDKKANRNICVTTTIARAPMANSPAETRLMNKAVDYLGRFTSSSHRLATILTGLPNANLAITTQKTWLMLSPAPSRAVGSLAMLTTSFCSRSGPQPPAPDGLLVVSDSDWHSIISILI